MICNSEMEPEVEELEDMQQQEHTVLTDNDSNLSNEPAEAKGSSASLKQNGVFLVLAISVIYFSLLYAVSITVLNFNVLHHCLFLVLH